MVNWQRSQKWNVNEQNQTMKKKVMSHDLFDVITGYAFNSHPIYLSDKSVHLVNTLA